MQRLGMEDLSKAAAFTLMSTDVAEVEQIISLIHETWSALLELGLGIYVLYLFVGYASFLIFIPSLGKSTHRKSCIHLPTLLFSVHGDNVFQRQKDGQSPHSVERENRATGGRDRDNSGTA